VNKLPGLSQADVDEDAILLRAYGKGTDVLIDRESGYCTAGVTTAANPCQRKHDRTACSPVTASRLRSTPGLRTVSYTNTYQAACARLRTCVGQRCGEGWLRGSENGMQHYL
jgi:hypothetical protein